MDKLLDFVGNVKQDEKEGNGGWVAAGVALVFVLILMAVFAWRAWKSGKETAKLLHEKAVREEQLHQAEIDEQLAESEEAKKVALENAEDLKGKIAMLEERRKSLEEDRRRAHAAIEKITSWEDVDALGR